MIAGYLAARAIDKSKRSVTGAATAIALAVGPLAALAQPAAPAQARPVVVTVAPEGVVQELRLRDDSVLFGRVVEAGAERVVFVTVAGARIEVRRTDIVSIRVARGEVSDGVFLRADPSPTRLFFAPTARPLPKGEAYIGVYEFMLPFAQVGVTNRLSIGGGTPLVFGGEGERVFWFTPKFTAYDDGRTSAAVGLFQFGGSGLDEAPGIAYGVVTLGKPDAAATVGLGYAYAGEDRTGIVMVAAERRLSRSVKFLSENWIWKGGLTFLSGGFRFMGESLSADLGLIVVIDDGDTFAFPAVNFSYHF